MNTPDSQARPAPRVGIPLKLSAETLAQPKLRIPIGVGFTYREKGTGETWTLVSLQSRRSVFLRSATGEVRDHVDVDSTLPDDYEHVGCNHESNCCTMHRTHVMPHRGCMLR